jgi:outer membrane immunogenic protein
MKKFLLAATAIATLGFAQSAGAADMSFKAPVYRPPVVTVYNWTGCYIGAHVGAGWGSSDWTNTANTTAFGDLTPGEGFSQTNLGFIGGGQLGCNYQLDRWVFGVEGTFSGSTIDGSLSNTVYGSADDVFNVKITSIATVTGRVGYTWNNVLAYVKGGYAGADVKFSVTDNVGPDVGSGSATAWHNGWTVGGGVEYGLTPNWILGLEYNYIGLQSKSYDVGGAGGIYSFDVKPSIHEVLARVSYKFYP